jgi:hypothetical protein
MAAVDLCAKSMEECPSVIDFSTNAFFMYMSKRERITPGQILIIKIFLETKLL